ncbi:MAG TPA: adenylate/guanylate cyclase domain-containing protein [Anaerolineales bacterium]|nr:adenylate/guanylate cyclase domain-containing protein [Anaerolineales bacterium]
MDSSKKPSTSDERTRLEQAIAALEAQRLSLGDDVADIAITSMQEKIVGIETGLRAAKEPQQRKLISILFADVSGFTAMAETMDHEIISDVINSLWSRVDKAILDHGGRIDKHIGDAIMALFGAPIAREDDAERAIRSALQIQSEILDWKKEQSEALPDYTTQIQNIQLRIGVNTGPALLGTVGTTNEYTAIGDTVNLASRLETAAPRGEILISNDTHQLVRGIFNVTELDPISVKGKSKPIQIFTVQSVKPRSFSDTTRGLEGIETRTIGRENELKKMQKVFEETAASKQTHLITLVAEAGTGKSRLLFEFGKWLENLNQPVQMLKGRNVQESTHIPYSLLRGIISSLFDIYENDRASVARQKLEQGIQKTSNDKDVALRAHFIGHLIGLDYSTSPHLKGILEDARQIRDRAFHYTNQLFTDLAHDQSLIIFLEDIHWADAGSLDFFESYMGNQGEIPLLIVSLTRSTLFEQRPDWGTSESVQTLRLDLLPLSEADTRRLISEILQKVPEIPDAILDLIVEKAEGSPYYVEELIKVLIEGGVIVRGEDQWSVEMKRLSDLKIPPTLTGLLQARLDSLVPNIRETLQQASVVGRVFWTDIVAQLHNPESQVLEDTVPVKEKMKVLHSKELVYPYEEASLTDALEYIFKNQILHDVTYESVLLRYRPKYHSQAAKGLVSIGGERINEFAGRVGEHFERAEAWIESAEWYARAGRQAQNTYEAKSAIHYYQKALEFLNEHGSAEQTSRKLEVMQYLGEVLNWMARYPEAVELYTTMLKEAETGDDTIAQARALLSLSASLSYQGDHQASLEKAIRAETLAESPKAKIELAKALRGQGTARFRLGEAQAALFLAEKSLDIFTDLNAQNEMARCLNLLAAVHYVSGRLSDAEMNWEKSLKIFKELNNRQEGMDLLSNLGVVADGLGDYETAFKRYNEALTIAREIGYKDGEIVFLTNRGSEYVALENYEAAEADLTQAIQLAGIAGSWCLPLTFTQRAEALIGLERYEEAYYSARQALALAEEDQTPEYAGMAWRTMGKISDRTNDVVRFSIRETHQMGEFDAETCFSKSADIFVESEIELEYAHTLREWAHYRIKSGDKDGGKKLWKQAQDIFANLGARMEVERMKDLPK